MLKRHCTLFIVYVSILGNNIVSNDLWNCCNPLGVVLDDTRTTKDKKNKNKAIPISHLWRCLFILRIQSKIEQFLVHLNKWFIIMKLIKCYWHHDEKQLAVDKKKHVYDLMVIQIIEQKSFEVEVDCFILELIWGEI